MTDECGFEPPCPDPVVDVAIYCNPRMWDVPACARHLAILMNPLELPQSIRDDERVTDDRSR